MRLIGRALLFVAFAALSAGCGQVERTRLAVSARHDSAIARLKTVPAPVKPAPADDAVEIRIPDFVEVRRALRKGDLAPLKAYLPEVMHRYDDGEISERTVERALHPLHAVLPQVLGPLDAWIAESPHENAAWLARGVVRSQLAFEARGVDFFKYVRREDMLRMNELYALAADDFVRSIELSKRPIPSIVGLISMAPVVGFMRKQARLLFAEAQRLEPASSMLYSSYASILWGTWGRATIPQMERFVADARRDGVDYAAWGNIERVLFGITHGNAFRNPRAELAHNIDACAKRDEFNCWFRRYELELELNLLDDAERSITAALRLRPDHIEALEQRAQLYERRGMLPQARETLEHAASRESGWAYAKLIYAHNTGNGLGIQKDEVKARLLAEEAAGMHIAAGADALSWFYQAGTGGLPQNVERAIAWELMAAHGGMARAANNRGYRLLNGQGMKRDYDEGIYWLRKAARAQDKFALKQLEQQQVSIEDPALKPGLFGTLELYYMRHRDGTTLDGTRMRE